MGKQEVFSITFAPGAVSADATVDLPAGCPEIGSLIEGAIMNPDATSGEITNTALTPAIEAADLSTGTFSAVDGNTIRLGTAATKLTFLRVTYRVK